MNTIIAAPWMNTIGIVCTPNVLWSITDSFSSNVDAIVDDTDVSIIGIMVKIAMRAER